MQKFKKIAALLMTAILVLSLAGFIFADEDNNSHLPHRIYASVEGEVIREGYNEMTGQKYIVIQGEHGEVHILVDSVTFMPERFPQEGEKIRAFYDFNAPMPMIYPPRYFAMAVTIIDEDATSSVFVGRFDENMVSFDNERRLIISDETEIIVADNIYFGSFQGEWLGEVEELFGEFGRLLYVEYDISHRDINPTTILPTRIVVLLERIAFGPAYIGDMLLDFEDEIFWLDDFFDFEDGIFWLEDPYMVFVPDNGIVVEGQIVPDAEAIIVGDSIWANYLPLRAVAEFLGETVSWTDATRNVTVTSPRGEISFYIGSPHFTVTTESGAVYTYTLFDAVLIEGTTYVPLRFFREVFGFNNSAFMSGAVFIDNEEVMN